MWVNIPLQKGQYMNNIFPITCGKLFAFFHDNIVKNVNLIWFRVIILYVALNKRLTLFVDASSGKLE